MHGGRGLRTDREGRRVLIISLYCIRDVLHSPLLVINYQISPNRYESQHSC